MLERILEKTIRIGRLTIIGPTGGEASFGDKLPDEPHLDVVIRLKSTLTALKIALRPHLYLGESYMDGSLIIEKGTLWDFLEICGRNLLPLYRSRQRRALSPLLRKPLLLLQQYNHANRARRNAAHHYDLSFELYRTFLDADLQYSCAYFREPDMTLEAAQAAKKDHIAGKLLLAPGLNVLDIGCGWGGLALHLAESASVRVTGTTLAAEQLAVARQRVHRQELEHLVTFELSDYRDISGSFDRIVSVGMFEHVGAPQYNAFFDTIRRLLADDGMALVHSIGRMSPPALTSGWVRKYIFPGGYVPALSEVMAAVERCGLWVTDVEIWRLHYAMTLRHWRERFLKHRQEMSRIYDERFCRMWEFYLAASEMSFRYDDLMVFQLQLTKKVDVAPLTRDYIFSGSRIDREAAPA